MSRLSSCTVPVPYAAGGSLLLHLVDLATVLPGPHTISQVQMRGTVRISTPLSHSIRMPGRHTFRLPSISLTRREVDVCRLLCQGRTVRQAAAEMGIGMVTANTHLYHAHAKLNVHCRADLVRRLASKGFLPITS